MMRIALRERAQRDAREKDEQARQKRIDEVEQELRRIEEEERRVKTLEPEAVAWQQAQRIREYIAAVEEDAAKETDSTEKPKLLEWADWAARQADRLDPLTASPASIVDEREELVWKLRSVQRLW